MGSDGARTDEVLQRAQAVLAQVESLLEEDRVLRTQYSVLSMQTATPANDGIVPPPHFDSDSTSLLKTLAARLRRLRELEANFAGQLEKEKLAAMRELAYGASHEINNPLANIATRAQTLLRDETDPERRRTLATINAQAFRAHEMIADLMLFAKPPAPALKDVDLTKLCQNVIAEARGDAEAQKTAIRGEFPAETVEIRADPAQVGVGLKALLQNSLEALRAGGNITVKVERLEDAVLISVVDNGPGLSEEVRRHMFDPFYSGREAGRGLGLGLSKCRRIVDLHGGEIVARSEPGKGTAISIRLPAATPAADSNPQCASR